MVRTFLAAIVLISVLGCNKQARTSVSGSVTLDGQPVSGGQVVFEPTSSGRLGIAQISDGAYTMPAAQGPIAGTYIVRVTASRPTGRKAKAGRGGDGKTLADQYEQYIPAKYNELSQLTTEITEEGTIVRDFNLFSK